MTRTTKELIAEFNVLATQLDRAPLNGWKGSKDSLALKVEDLRSMIDPEPLGDVEPDTVPETVAEAAAAEPVDPVKPRRTIGALVSRLLLDADLDYAQIVELVRAEFPEAQTSTRSVASVAKDLRKKGVVVASRQVGKRLKMTTPTGDQPVGA